MSFDDTPDDSLAGNLEKFEVEVLVNFLPPENSAQKLVHIIRSPPNCMNGRKAQQNI